jgi:Na+-driven multidrug efflux pump
VSYSITRFYFLCPSPRTSGSVSITSACVRLPQVGQYLGSVSLSAYGLSERVFVFGFYILNFLATSTTPIVAKLRAQGEEEAARELVGRLLFFATLFGFALIPVLQMACYPLLNLLGAVPQNFQEAVEYYQVSRRGVVFHQERVHTRGL